MRVDVLVVGHIVLVIRKRREHRVEVEGAHAEALQVIEALPDALQVPAIEHQREDLVLRWKRFPGVGARPMSPVLVLVRARSAGRIAVGEAVGEDLVEHRRAQPGRRRSVGQEPKSLESSGS